MKEKTYPVISRNLDDLDVPGVQLEMSREEVEAFGMCEETAMSEDEAWESNADLAMTRGEPGNDEELPYFVPDDEGPSDDLPTFYHTFHAHELFDMRPGERLLDALERQAKEQAEAAGPRKAREG